MINLPKGSIHNKVQKKKKEKKKRETDRPDRKEEERKKKKGEGDGQTEREEEEKKERRRRRRRRRRSSCFTAPPLLRHRLLPFLLLLCFCFPYKWDFSCYGRYPFTDRNSWISPVQPVRGRYSQYFFRYETRELSIPVHWPVRYILDVSADTVRNWLLW